VGEPSSVQPQGYDVAKIHFVGDAQTHRKAFHHHLRAVDDIRQTPQDLGGHETEEEVSMRESTKSELGWRSFMSTLGPHLEGRKLPLVVAQQVSRLRI
jgi:hypothetical protein